MNQSLYQIKNIYILHINILQSAILLIKIFKYHNKKKKVNPVPKGMSILNVIHDCNPTLQTNYLFKWMFLLRIKVLKIYSSPQWFEMTKKVTINHSTSYYAT